jgi:amino acid adenylation domain-containing protein
MQHQTRDSDVFEQQWSRNDASGSSEDTITLRFEQQVAAAPDRLALVTDEISLTYRALDLKARRIAAALASLPSQRDRPIALYVKDEVARITAMLGALKAGRIFIPLAPDSPDKWLTQVIEDSGTAQIIVDSPTRSIAQLAAASSTTVIEVEQLTPSSHLFAVDRITYPDDTACIIYTSGSTGRPKGVANSHRRVIRNSDVRFVKYGITHDDRYGSLASSSGAAGIAHTFLALLSGLSLFPFDPHRHGLQEIAPWLNAQKITVLFFITSLLRTWLASLPDNLRFPTLRMLTVGGEALFAQDLVRIGRHLEGHWQIGHCYSSTEAGVIAVQVLDSSHLPDGGVVAAGHPVDGMEVCLQDETGAPVPPGGVGEIVVSSRFLSRGYWNDPDLTAKVFQTDPVDSSIRTYRTGDLGRWRSDGALEHLGRRDRRIRLRGYNIEPFQVESELMRQAGVSDAIVVLHDGAAGQEPCLVGYVVAPPNASTSDMRTELAERLPSYMIPSHIVALDSFPIASSGKIDRNALPPPNREEARLVAFRAPSDDRERKLLTIWQEVLKIQNIGIDDDFFELGGSSLQALTVFLEIEARLGCILSPTTMTQASTIAGLAEVIRTSTRIETSQSLVTLRAGTGLPLFLVGVLFSLGTHYRHLVSDLKCDCPIFGLQPPPLDGKHRIPRTIESIAADYVSEIRRVQPHGPYFLAGHSFGGLLSFEIAQQLVGEGERVSFLGLIDPVLHDMAAPAWVFEAARISRKVRRVQRFEELLFRGLRYLFLSAHIYVLRYVRNLILDLWLRLGGSIPYKYRYTYYDWLRFRASRAYVPKPYAGHITMFSSAGNSERQTAHWGLLARGGLTVVEGSSEHDHMVTRPHSKFLAEYFDSCLNTTGCVEEVVRPSLEKC